MYIICRHKLYCRESRLNTSVKGKKYVPTLDKQENIHTLIILHMSIILYILYVHIHLYRVLSLLVRLIKHFNFLL